MSSSLSNSPIRSSQSKRKVTDTNMYKPPVSKTHLVAESQLASSSSYSAAYQPFGFFNNPTASHLLPSSHVKTFSLPVAFDSQAPFMPNSSYNYPYNYTNPALQYQQPPNRVYYPNGDVPLPTGWSCERTTPTGQFYYFNHATKTTTWEDPRKMYNLPMNQSEISMEMRMHIARNVPLPSGWEEAQCAKTGQVYFIDHNNRTTTWQDPRIGAYMTQQEQMKYQYGPITQHHHQQQQQRLSCSSTSSLASSVSSSSSNHSLASPVMFNSHIEGLKKSLNEISQQKASIQRQIDEICKQESQLRSKLSPGDLEDVMKRSQTDYKVPAGREINKNDTNIKIKTENIDDNENGVTTSSAAEALNDSNNLNNTTTTSDMDSTFVGENGNN